MIIVFYDLFIKKNQEKINNEENGISENIGKGRNIKKIGFFSIIFRGFKQNQLFSKTGRNRRYFIFFRNSF